MQNLFTKEFITQSVIKLAEYTQRIKICFKELNEEEIWKRPNESSNSIGNIVLHLCGNVRQYIISSLGGTTDIRERDHEFSAMGGLNKDDLIKKLDETVTLAINVIKNCDEQSLLKVRSVQGFQYSGLAIIIHVIEHYAYHTGQVVFWTKLLKNRDLGFYSGIDLNKKNQPLNSNIILYTHINRIILLFLFCRNTNSLFNILFSFGLRSPLCSLRRSHALGSLQCGLLPYRGLRGVCGQEF